MKIDGSYEQSPISWLLVNKVRSPVGSSTKSDVLKYGNHVLYLKIFSLFGEIYSIKNISGHLWSVMGRIERVQSLRQNIVGTHRWKWINVGNISSNERRSLEIGLCWRAARRSEFVLRTHRNIGFGHGMLQTHCQLSMARMGTTSN